MQTNTLMVEFTPIPRQFQIYDGITYSLTLRVIVSAMVKNGKVKTPSLRKTDYCNCLNKVTLIFRRILIALSVAASIPCLLPTVSSSQFCLRIDMKDAMLIQCFQRNIKHINATIYIYIISARISVIDNSRNLPKTRTMYVNHIPATQKQHTRVVMFTQYHNGNTIPNKPAK